MGYFRPQTVTRYTFPSSANAQPGEEAYWFDWKNFVPYGDVKTVSKRIADEAKATGTKAEDIAPDMINAALVMSYVSAWNVSDASGAVLPLVGESLDKLEDIDASCLMEKLQERMTAKAVERKN